MEPLKQFPSSGQAPGGYRTPRGGLKCGLRLPQVRVLQVLSEAGGPISRGRISERCGNKTDVVVGRAVGYSDPVKRRAFRMTPDGKTAGTPLLDSKYVTEEEIDVDGVKETGISITEAGRRVLALALAELGGELPPLRD